jgi:hypothetical protein
MAGPDRSISEYRSITAGDPVAAVSRRLHRRHCAPERLRSGLILKGDIKEAAIWRPLGLSGAEAAVITCGRK